MATKETRSKEEKRIEKLTTEKLLQEFKMSVLCLAASQSRIEEKEEWERKIKLLELEIYHRIEANKN